MTMRAVVCIPWRGGDPVREANHQTVLGTLTRFDVIEGDSDPTLPFNRAQARNRAAMAAGDWDVAAFVDACCLIEPGDLMHGVLSAALSGSFVLPAARGHYEIIDGAPAAKPYAFHPGAVVVIPRPVWDIVGGYDERFTAWGYEDSAILNAAATLATVAAGDRRSYHLPHPRDPGADAAGTALWERYLAAQYRPDAMRALLAERAVAA